MFADRCMRSDAIFFVQNDVVCLQIDACGLMRFFRIGCDSTVMHSYSSVCSLRQMAYPIRPGFFSETLFILGFQRIKSPENDIRVNFGFGGLKCQNECLCCYHRPLSTFFIPFPQCFEKRF